jgi:putative nucleotidyltransferase with HDIG domain
MAPYYAISGPLALACSEAYDRLGAVGLLAFTAPPGFMMISVHQYVKRTESSVVRLREANEELERRAEKIRRTHFATIGALARSMEAKDGYTGGHTERVSDVAVALAVRLGFEGDELDAIRTGALLHDIGKIGIPEQIINKPGPLDEDEWAVMKTHPVISEYILAEAGLHEFVCQAARSSHEAVDGSGYPDGLVGEEIPLPARIAAVADTLDALTSDRSYRKSRSLDQAMEEVRKHTGTQFCPRVVAALEQVYAEEPETLVDAAPTPHLAAAA